MLNTAGLPRVTANTVSTGIAFIFSFFANKNYTFKSAGGNLKRQIIMFIIVTLFGLWVIQNIIIYFLLPILNSVFNQDQIALLTAKILATAVSLIWNYVLYDRLVFAQQRL